MIPLLGGWSGWCDRCQHPLSLCECLNVPARHCPACKSANGTHGREARSGQLCPNAKEGNQ